MQVYVEEAEEESQASESLASESPASESLVSDHQRLCHVQLKKTTAYS